MAVLLPIQAALYFAQLGLLPVWGDEVSSLWFIRGTLPELFRALAADVHPPLYFLLLRFWEALPLGLSPIVQARALSVVFSLLATVALDRCWARELPGRTRPLVLALWIFSPCLLIYSRMARSYSLQWLVSTVAVYAIWRMGERPTRAAAAAVAACVAAALYVHYVPGLALLAILNVWLVWKDRGVSKRLAAIDAAVLVAYLPWLPTLLKTLGRWGGTEPYSLSGTSAIEIPLKLAYWSFAFVAGEAAPDWVAVAGVAMTVVAAALAASGAKRNPRLAIFTAVISAVGFLGVVRFVAYPFVPARMAFVFPFYLLLLAAGIGAHRRVGPVAAVALLLFSASGIWHYFGKSDFLNKGYVAPVEEIAAEIRGRSTPADSAVLADVANSDHDALSYLLEDAGWHVRLTGSRASLHLPEKLVADPKIRAVWLMRNKHDVTRGKVNDAIAARLRESMPVRVRVYLPFSPLQLWAARALGIHDLPTHFYELLEFRR